MSKKNKDLVIIPCPPYSDFPDQPPDQSKSELIDCPLCKNKMWLSEKKKTTMLIAEQFNKDILMACYTCLNKFIKENKDLFKKAKEVKAVNI